MTGLLKSTVQHIPYKHHFIFYRAFNLLLVEPKNGNVTFTIALLYHNLGETFLALEYLDRTVEICPTDSSVFKAKGRLYHSEH